MGDHLTNPSEENNSIFWPEVSSIPAIWRLVHLISEHDHEPLSKGAHDHDDRRCWSVCHQCGRITAPPTISFDSVPVINMETYQTHVTSNKSKKRQWEVELVLKKHFTELDTRSCFTFWVPCAFYRNIKMFTCGNFSLDFFPPKCLPAAWCTASSVCSRVWQFELKVTSSKLSALFISSLLNLKTSDLLTFAPEAKRVGRLKIDGIWNHKSNIVLTAVLGRSWIQDAVNPLRLTLDMNISRNLLDSSWTLVI